MALALALFFSPYAAAQPASVDAGGSASESAAPSRPGVELGARALPAVIAVGAAGPNATTWGFAAGLGYGWMGSGGAVHPGYRLSSSLAAAYSPAKAWTFGGDLRGRWDSLDGDESSNLYGEPRLLARYSGDISARVHWGAELDLRLVGAEAPSIDLAATSPALRGLFTWRINGRSWLTGQLGLHLDRSAEAVPDASRVSGNDKQSLGASSWSTLPLGIGTSYQLGSSGTELLAEVAGEVLLGGPGLSQSPTHLGLGARQPLTSALALMGALEVSLSQRPDSLRGPDLLPIEPRLGGVVNLIWHIDRPVPKPAIAPLRPPPPIEKQPEPKVVVPEAAPTGSVKGTVVDEGGRPLPDVEVQLLQPNAPATTQRTDATGAFEFTAVPLVAGELVVAAESYESARVNLPANGPTADSPRQSEIVMRPAVPAGQVKGKVLDIKGEAVVAEIKITPGDQVVAVQADGSFELELAPGNYLVTFEHPDFSKQQRRIKVVDRGVVILNIALVR